MALFIMCRGGRGIVRRCMAVAATAMLGLVFLPGSALASSPGVDARVTKQVLLPGIPVATTMSADGKTLFILGHDGTVAMYEPGGRLRGTVHVGAGSTDIAASPDGQRLYVTDRERKTLKIIEIDYIISLREGNSPVLGPANAPVSIVVFSDFQCPYCVKLNPLLQQVMKKYPHRVKLTYKFFPLASIHPLSMPAAIAALAAERQGKFWKYHDALLEFQWDLSEARFVDIAKNLGLDMERFARDRKDPRLVNRIRKDMQEAKAAQVRGVPAVFINGRRLKQRSLAGFDQLIQHELQRLRVKSKK